MPALTKLLEEVTFPPEFMVSYLDQDLCLASVYAIDVLLGGDLGGAPKKWTDVEAQLQSLSPGSENAREYHRLAADILATVFAPQLPNLVIEQEVHGELGYIDGVLDNCAHQGFFFDLPARHGIKCPHIPFECKNVF